MPCPLLLLSLLSCAEDADTGGELPEPDGPGTLLLSFTIEEDVILSMDELPVGDFRGSVFYEDQATAVGPLPDAESLEDMVVSMDLSAGTVLDAHTTVPLEAGIYWILGCLDVDGNDCDKADPITVPNENKFQVDADEEVAAEIFMSMLNPT